MQAHSVILIGVILALATFGVAGCGSDQTSEGPSSSEEPKVDPKAVAAVEEALDWFESEDARMATMIASGRNTVKTVLCDSAQMQVLLKHKELAVEAILLRRGQSVPPDKAYPRVAWYSLLEKSDDKRAVPAILDDMARFPEDKKNYLGSLADTFSYGLDSLRIMRPDVDLKGSAHELFEIRDKLEERF